MEGQESKQKEGTYRWDGDGGTNKKVSVRGSTGIIRKGARRWYPQGGDNKRDQ